MVDLPNYFDYAGHERRRCELVRNLYLALNMTVAACIPGGRPRETISGRVGRCWPTSLARKVIDAAHWWDRDHCGRIARLERDARAALHYPD